jgi:hypothetical protein
MTTQLAVMPQVALPISDNTDMLTLTESEAEEILIETYLRLENKRGFRADPFQIIRDELADEDFVITDAELNRFLGEIEADLRCVACLRHADSSPKDFWSDLCDDCKVD